MAFQGLHLESLSQTSSEYALHRPKFKNLLVKLYRITYKKSTTNAADTAENWSTGLYFHGTGHCGCLHARQLASDMLIKADEWCNGTSCATRGILQFGHLMQLSFSSMNVYCCLQYNRQFYSCEKINAPTFCYVDGHFFSENLQTSMRYAMGKSGGNGIQLLPIFLCRIRNANPKGDICSVAKDSVSANLPRSSSDQECVECVKRRCEMDGRHDHFLSLSLSRS